MRICQEFEDANDAITLSKTYLTLHADQVRGISRVSFLPKGNHSCICLILRNLFRVQPCKYSFCPSSDLAQSTAIG